jgi:excisionase family DNA binding protein
MEEVLVLARDRKPGVLKVMEVADELRIGRNQAYELVRSGQLRAVRIGQAIRVTREALDEFKAGREAASRER